MTNIEFEEKLERKKRIIKALKFALWTFIALNIVLFSCTYILLDFKPIDEIIAIALESAPTESEMRFMILFNLSYQAAFITLMFIGKYQDLTLNYKLSQVGKHEH